MAKKAVRAAKTAGRGADQYVVRFPEGMRDAIARLAESNGRSINTEIIAAIEQHLRGPSRLDALEAFVDKHRKMLDDLAEIKEWLIDDLGAQIEKLQADVRDHDESLHPNRYDDD